MPFAAGAKALSTFAPASSLSPSRQPSPSPIRNLGQVLLMAPLAAKGLDCMTDSLREAIS